MSNKFQYDGKKILIEIDVSEMNNLAKYHLECGIQYQTKVVVGVSSGIQTGFALSLNEEDRKSNQERLKNLEEGLVFQRPKRYKKL